MSYFTAAEKAITLKSATLNVIVEGRTGWSKHIVITKERESLIIWGNAEGGSDWRVEKIALPEGWGRETTPTEVRSWWAENKGKKGLTTPYVKCSTGDSGLDMLVKLASVSKTLFENDIPSFVWEDDGEPNEYTGHINHKPNWHWTATKQEAECLLERKMTSEEVTLLSIGRGFGPMPAIEDYPELEKELLAYLWPEGDTFGDGLDWEQLAEELEFYCRVVNATKRDVDNKVCSVVHSILNDNNGSSSWEPTLALNNFARRYQRAGKLDLAVHFAKELPKELEKQLLELAQKRQSPAWGHLKRIFNDDTINRREEIFKLYKTGTLPVGALYSGANAVVEAQVNYQNYIREQGVIEHLQDL